MKKCQFFSMGRSEDGSPTIKMQNGFTDGEYNYYSEGRGHWHCIDPQTGLSVATGGTKEKAQGAAELVIDKFEQVKSTKYYKEKKELFAELRLYGGKVAK